MLNKCPKCTTQFSSEDHLLVPLILPTCRHSLCRGCLPRTKQCPVERCHAIISSKDKERAPVNYTLLGKVIVENLKGHEKHTSATPLPPNCASVSGVKSSYKFLAESEPVEITSVIEQCILKTRSLLAMME